MDIEHTKKLLIDSMNEEAKKTGGGRWMLVNGNAQWFPFIEEEIEEPKNWYVELESNDDEPEDERYVDGIPESEFIERCQQKMRDCWENYTNGTEEETDDSDVEDESEDDEETGEESEIEPNDDAHDRLVDACFTLEDLDIIQNMELPVPSDIKDAERDALYDKAEKLSDKIKKTEGSLCKKL